MLSTMLCVENLALIPMKKSNSIESKNMTENRLTQAMTAFEEYKNEKKEIIDYGLSLPGVKKQKYYYPMTQFLLRMITFFNGESISFLNEKNVRTPIGRPIIFANAHKFKPDIEKITLSIKRPSVMMASDFKNSYKTINGWYFGTRPTIFVDPYSKEDKNYTYKMMVRYLQEGHDCMIFPEAVWNLSENKIVLETFFGTVRAALESNAVIICTAIERYGKKYIINRKDYFDPSLILNKYTDKSYAELQSDSQNKDLVNEILTECNRELRDAMATLTFEIWEDHAKKFGVESRTELPADYWQTFVTGLTSEWPGYKMSDNVEQRFHSKLEIEHEHLRADLKNIRPTMQNAFLFNKRLKL